MELLRGSRGGKCEAQMKPYGAIKPNLCTLSLDIQVFHYWGCIQNGRGHMNIRCQEEFARLPKRKYVI